MKANSTSSALFDFERTANAGRQDELDVLKACILWSLVLCHTVLVLKIDLDSAFSFYEWLCYYASSAAGAQIFMLCMGVGMVYSRSQQPSQLMRRGVSLLALGYALNFFRNFVSMLASGVHPYHPGELTLMQSLFEVDILQFAGLSFLFFGLLKQWRLSDYSMLLTTLFLVALGGFLNGHFPMGTSVGASLVGLFVFTNELGSFPFFSWIIYPVAGYFLGKLLLHCLDKPRFYRAMFLLGLALTIGFVAGCLRYGITFDAMFDDQWFYGQNPIATYGFLSIALLWPPAAYVGSRLFSRQWMRATIRRWSGNLTVIYFVSWLLLAWLSAALTIFGVKATVSQSCWMYFSVSVIVYFLSDAIAVGYKTFRNHKT